MTVHNANMRNMKVNPDGSLSGRMVDPYDFEKWSEHKYTDVQTVIPTLKHNITTGINNNAYEQQQAGKLENFYISMPVNYTQKEIENLRSKYSAKKINKSANNGQ